MIGKRGAVLRDHQAREAAVGGGRGQHVVEPVRPDLPTGARDLELLHVATEVRDRPQAGHRQRRDLQPRVVLHAEEVPVDLDELVVAGPDEALDPAQEPAVVDRVSQSPGSVRGTRG